MLLFLLWVTIIFMVIRILNISVIMITKQLVLFGFIDTRMVSILPLSLTSITFLPNSLPSITHLFAPAGVCNSDNNNNMNIDYLIAEKWSGQNRTSRTGFAAPALT